MRIFRMTAMAAAILTATTLSQGAMASTQLHKVSVSCAGQLKFYEQIETTTKGQAVEIIKKRYPGCMVIVETSAKRVSPKH